MLAEALRTAQAIDYDGERAEVLEELAPHLPAELLGQAVETARAIQDDEVRAWMLGVLAPLFA